MDRLEQELTRTLASRESQPLLSRDLTDAIRHEVRRRRRRVAIATATLASVTLGAVVATGWLVLTHPPTREASVARPAGPDCSGVKAQASGVSSYRITGGGREVTLVLHGTPGRASYTCPINERTEVIFTTEQGARVSSVYTTDDTTLIRPRSTVLIDLQWTNWCSSGTVTASTALADGSTVDLSLGKNIATPSCTSPTGPALLQITNVQATDVESTESR